jgi:hypothetical protein
MKGTISRALYYGHFLRSDNAHSSENILLDRLRNHVRLLSLRAINRRQPVSQMRCYLNRHLLVKIHKGIIGPRANSLWLAPVTKRIERVNQVRLGAANPTDKNHLGRSSCANITILHIQLSEQPDTVHRDLLSISMEV